MIPPLPAAMDHHASTEAEMDTQKTDNTTLIDARTSMSTSTLTDQSLLHTDNSLADATAGYSLLHTHLGLSPEKPTMKSHLPKVAR